MASVNVTCTSCTGAQCERCRSIVRAVHAAGHSVTPSSRYEALRAAARGVYGFDACVVVLEGEEPSVVDAVRVLFGHARVALVGDPSKVVADALPVTVSLIDPRALDGDPFPTGWIDVASAPPSDGDQTRTIDAPLATTPDVEAARRRIKGMARRAQHELGDAGFGSDTHLDLLALLEDEIAWAKMSGTQFGLVLVHVTRKPSAPPASAQATLDRTLERLRRAVRASDLIARGSDSLLVVIAEAGMAATSLAAGRIKKSLRRSIKEAGSPARAESLTLGIAVCPDHGTTRASLLARATASATPL